MFSIPELRAATQLWIVVDSDDRDTQQICQQLSAVNSARDQMLSGEITVDDFLDVLADSGVDIDHYESVTEENFAEMLHGGINTD